VGLLLTDAFDVFPLFLFSIRARLIKLLLDLRPRTPELLDRREAAVGFFVVFDAPVVFAVLFGTGRRVVAFGTGRRFFTL
jgi:hypothetical protein